MWVRTLLLWRVSHKALRLSGKADVLFSNAPEICLGEVLALSQAGLRLGKAVGWLRGEALALGADLISHHTHGSGSGQSNVMRPQACASRQHPIIATHKHRELGSFLGRQERLLADSRSSAWPPWQLRRAASFCSAGPVYK